MSSNFDTYLYLLKSDLYRYTGKKITWKMFRRNMRRNWGFQYSFWLRTCKFLSGIRRIRFFLLPIANSILTHYMIKYGIGIPYTTQIGPGFYISHIGGIIVHNNCVIGKNCNISQGVTLGQTNRGARKGTPTIGDNVYIGPGAVVIGNIKIGNNVAIGANCVVTKDVPDNGVVVGVPGKVISYQGSSGYINRTDYDDLVQIEGKTPLRSGAGESQP